MGIEIKNGINVVLQWIKANRVMLSNTWSLVGTTAVTSGLGFVYWWLAARQYTPEAVGLASAAVSTMMLLGSIGMLGLGTLLITELPRQPGRAVSLISTGVIVVGGVGGIIGVLFAVFAPYISLQFAPLRASALNVGIFALGVGLTAATSVLDQAVIGILRGNFQLWRNVLFSIAKLVLLFVAGLYLSQKTGMTIYTTWAAGMILSMFVLFGYTLFKRGWQGKAYLPQWQFLRKLGLAALQHHLFNLLLQVPTQLLPVLVTMLLSAQTNAWFYVSWMIASFVFVVPYSLTMVLHAMGSAKQSSLGQQARTTLGVAFAVCLGIDLFLFFGARWVLGLFGSAYAEQSTWCLRILVLAAFPGIIRNHYISFCRIYDRVAKATLGIVLGGILELGGAVLGAHLAGLLGLSLGWLVAVTVEGLFMFPFVYRVVRPVKRASKTALLETSVETDPIWLVDTLILAAMPLHQTTADLSVHTPANSPVKTETVKHMVGTLTQPLPTVKYMALDDLAVTHEVRKRNSITDLPLYLIPLGAFLIWCLSLQGINVSQMNDLGLVSVLSPGMIVASVILVGGFIFVLQRKRVRPSLLALHLIGIILILYATPTLVEHLPTLYVYKHAGYTEYIMRRGMVDPYLDFYFDIPGFFVLSAFLTKVCGYSTILEYAGWAPVFYNLLYLGPLYIILRSITTNKRIVWLGLLLFYLTNWVGQDYFSPQGLSFFLYLVIMAILLKWFRILPKKPVQQEKNASFKQRLQTWLSSPDTEYSALQPWQQRCLLCCLICIFGLMVFSHPLTPFFTLLSVGFLMLFRRCKPFWLPILMAIMTAAWILIMMRPYLSQHGSILASFGNLVGNVPVSITTGKMTSDALYQIVGKMRLSTTLLLWFLALLGCIKRLRQGHRDITCMLLAVSGFPLIVAQSYGGEMLMRIYLFTQPYMVFFVAALFCENPQLTVRRLYTRTISTTFWRTAVIMVAHLILLGGFFFTRYGDERVNLISPVEWNAVQYLYKVAPERSFILAAWDGTPLFFENYEKYTIQQLQNRLPDAIVQTNANKVVQFLANDGSSNTYVIFTQEQQILATAWAGLPPDALRRLETGLLKTGKFRLIYASPDTQILQFIGAEN